MHFHKRARMAKMNVGTHAILVPSLYAKPHPCLRGIRITEITTDAFGGGLVALRAENFAPHEEITFVHVHIVDTGFGS